MRCARPRSRATSRRASTWNARPPPWWRWWTGWPCRHRSIRRASTWTSWTSAWPSCGARRPASVEPVTVEPLRFEDDALLILDQRALPGEERWIRCERPEQVAECIRTLAVRGAPAIGIAAAYGMALAGAERAAPDPERAPPDAEGAAADGERAAPHLLRPARPPPVHLPRGV